MLKLLAVELKGKAAGHPVSLGGHGHFPRDGGVGVGGGGGGAGTGGIEQGRHEPV